MERSHSSIAHAVGSADAHGFVMWLLSFLLPRNSTMTAHAKSPGPFCHRAQSPEGTVALCCVCVGSGCRS
jgi:hypothetical protein